MNKTIINANLLGACYLAYLEGKQPFRRYNNEPYINHCLRVAHKADDLLGGIAWEIGLCHDLFEDTSIDANELGSLLKTSGYPDHQVKEIIKGVNYLTDIYTSEDFPNKKRKERKRLEAIALGEIPAFHQTIKVLDLLDNTPSICEADPKFGAIYLEEKLFLLSKLTKANSSLLTEAHDMIKFYKIKNERNER